jgi:hypothetical protein
VMHNPYAAPASRIDDARGIDARASIMAGALVAALAVVRILSWAVAVYVGVTGSDVLVDLPPGIWATVSSEVMAFPLFAPFLALLYGILAIPLLRGSRRFRWPTLAVQALYTIMPLIILRMTVVRARGPSSVRLSAANLLLALLSAGILLLLLWGRSTPGRLRHAWVGIALLSVVWTTRLLGLF